MTTDSDMWKCKRCGLGPRDCKCTRFLRRMDWWTLALAVMLATVLWALPVGAQCGCEGEPVPEPVAPAFSLYMPLAATPAEWFDQAELEDAQRRHGFDPAVVGAHTWCELDESALPPAVIRYAHCFQNWVEGPTDGSPSVYYWRAQSSGRVTALVLSSVVEGDEGP